MTTFLAALVSLITADPNAAVSLPGAPVPVQWEYVGEYIAHHDDPSMILFEDGSISFDN